MLCVLQSGVSERSVLPFSAIAAIASSPPACPPNRFRLGRLDAMPSGYSSIIGKTLLPRPLLNTSISVSPETRNFKKLTFLYLQVWKTLSNTTW